MARTKKLTGSGRLHRDKLPARVLECVCSWDMTPRELSEELHVERPKIWRALCNLRKCQYIEDVKPRVWNQIVKATPKGQDALEAYTLRLHNVDQ